MACHLDLLLGLHPLGDQSQPHAMGEIQDVFDDMAGGAFLFHSLDKAAIDFDDVHMEHLQIAEAGVAGAKVIDGDEHAQLVQGIEDGAGLLVRIHHLPLRHLEHQAQILARESAKKVAALGDDVLVFEVLGADIDGDVKAGGQPVGHPDQIIPGLGHQLASHRHYVAALLREGDEVVGGNHPLCGMTPAHQHFTTAQAPLPVHHGLQMGDELPGRHGSGKLAAGGAAAPPQIEGEQPQQQRQHRGGKQVLLVVRPGKRQHFLVTVERHQAIGMSGGLALLQTLSPFQ